MKDKCIQAYECKEFDDGKKKAHLWVSKQKGRRKKKKVGADREKRRVDSSVRE